MTAREKIAILICEDAGDTWDLAPDNYQEDYRRVADQILALQGEDWRLAVVEKNGKLPEIPIFSYDDEEYQPYLQRGAINYSKMLEGWVKEVEK